MSRGPGKIELHVLARLQQELSEFGLPQPVTTYELARSWVQSIGGTAPTRPQRKSVLRAIHGLEARGLVEVEGRRPRQRDYYWIGGEELAVHLTWTQAHHERVRAEWPRVAALLGRTV